MLSHKVTVRTVAEKHYQDKNQIGETDYGIGEITILEDLSRDTAAQTLLHEIVHFIDRAQYIGLDERQVQCLANGLLSLLKDNPGFVDTYINPGNATE